MPLLADYDLGDALLTVIAVFLFVAWFWILITIIADLFSDHETSGWAKAAWVFGLIFFPFLGVLVYLIARGGGMSRRSLERQQEAKAEFDSYVREQASSASPADELAKLSELKDKGEISDEEFEKAKSRLL